MRTTSRYIVLVLVVILIVYLALLDTLAKPLFEAQASEMYGAEVSVSALEFSPFAGSVTLHTLQIADRRNAMHNLAQAERAYIDISILKLAEDIIDVEELRIDGLMMFTPREQAAVILRPLLEDDDPIAQAGLPDFKLPDVDSLVARQRSKLNADMAGLRQTFATKEEKWRSRVMELPSAEDLASYRERIARLKAQKDAAGNLTATPELRTVIAELHSDVARLQSMQQEFRGDLQLMREAVDLVSTLAQRHTDELIHSLGLSNEQIAQLGSQILRGDFDGLLQQVLAPLAYNKSGAAVDADDMPIYINSAHFNGQLLPSAAGLSTRGELTGFAWPLEIAADATLLYMTGTSLGGGDLLIEASIDHRGNAIDAVIVAINRLPLQDMRMAGGSDVAVVMQQALATINGEMSLRGEELRGAFTQHFTDAVFKTELSDTAGDATQLIASLLHSTTDFMLQIELGGTVFSPQMHLGTDLDQIFQNSMRDALSGQVNRLTTDLQNRISNEIGPEIANARIQFEGLESLQADLETTLGQLSQIPQ